jgi:hypothetical protein
MIGHAAMSAKMSAVADQVFIDLTATQRDDIAARGFLPESFRALVASAALSGRRATVALDPDAVEKVRDVLTHELARSGFDANDELNAEGQVLEDLIDALFVP